MTERKVCDVCGLRIPLCNAIASWRRATELFQRGEMERAAEWAATAEMYYTNWRGEAG
jgi:hypothetical protein